ncbi:NUDIX hydrolase domain-like protein [Penicillium taxi]|uniref:NUDIX hydrolase domain-like protein n=1 Tax=Penicillium taxi TaxID=168475 RepID=UPI0025450A0D|nr:NUDIX hydrolase domain-like protein [Penicillium taxi]KAJ5893227.1 NUDIX hydrolase domain-like protein [Penicillium taxi]
MTTPPKVRVGVGAFILQSNNEPQVNPHFLVGKRINAHGSGTYALPGGHLEFGETPEQCATRELSEETGLAVTNVRFLTATNDYMPADNKHYITMFMVCERVDEATEPRVLEPDKCEGWEWISWDDLNEWAKIERGGKDVLGRKLFTPFLSLLEQRPEVLPLSL